MIDIKNIGKEDLPIVDVEWLHKNKCLFGLEISDKSEFLFKIGNRDAEQEEYLTELDEDDSKNSDIYERYTNSWEFNDIMNHIDFNIDWLKGQLELDDYLKLEDYILSYCKKMMNSYSDWILSMHGLCSMNAWRKKNLKMPKKLVDNPILMLLAKIEDSI